MDTIAVDIFVSCLDFSGSGVPGQDLLVTAFDGSGEHITPPELPLTDEFGVSHAVWEFIYYDSPYCVVVTDGWLRDTVCVTRIPGN
jgi:hypothetical protein